MGEREGRLDNRGRGDGPHGVVAAEEPTQVGYKVKVLAQQPAQRLGHLPVGVVGIDHIALREHPRAQHEPLVDKVWQQAVLRVLRLREDGPQVCGGSGRNEGGGGAGRLPMRVAVIAGPEGGRRTGGRAAGEGGSWTRGHLEPRSGPCQPGRTAEAATCGPLTRQGTS